MKNQRIRRKTGLQRPFNNYQIASWVILLFEFITTYFVFLPALSGLEKSVFVGLISSTLVLLVFNGYLATAIDPSDPTVAEEHAAREKGETYLTSLKHVCSLCNAHVRPRTKHCGQCDRCVDVFDHHCQWFNNCIGFKNYRNFAFAIISLFIEASLKIIFGAICLHRFGAFRDEFVENISSFYSSAFDPSWIIFAIIILSVALNFIIWLLSLQLLILHSWLKTHKMTTYEYIVMKRQRLQNGDAKQREYKSKVIQKVDDMPRVNNHSFHSYHHGEEHTNIKLLGKSYVQPSDITLQDTKRLDKSAISIPPTRENAAPYLKNSEEANLPVIKGHDTSMDIDLEAAKSSEDRTIQHSASRPMTFDDEPADMSQHHPRKAMESVPGSEIKLNPNIIIEKEDQDCNLEKSDLESSKIMRFVEAVKDKVVFKNPLNKLLFLGFDNPADLSLVSHPSAREQIEISIPFSARNSHDMGKSSTNDEEGHAKSHRGYGEIKGFTYSKALGSTKITSLNKLDQILGARDSVMTSISSEPSDRGKSNRQMSAPEHDDMSLGDGDMKITTGAQQYGDSNLNHGFKFKNTFSRDDFK